MLYEGTFAVHRKVLKNWLSPAQEKRKFERLEAWLWLLASAYFTCQREKVQNEYIVIFRGSFTCTVEGLSETWKWNRRTTEKFLKELEKDGSISRTKINPQNKKSYTLLKINNYNDFQPKIDKKCTSEYTSECTLECTLNKKVDKKDNKNIIGNNFFKKIFNKAAIDDFDYD